MLRRGVRDTTPPLGGPAERISSRSSAVNGWADDPLEHVTCGTYTLYDPTALLHT